MKILSGTSPSNSHLRPCTWRRVWSGPRLLLCQEARTPGTIYSFACKYCALVLCWLNIRFLLAEAWMYLGVTARITPADRSIYATLSVFKSILHYGMMGDPFFFLDLDFTSHPGTRNDQMKNHRIARMLRVELLEVSCQVTPSVSSFGG